MKVVLLYFSKWFKKPYLAILITVVVCFLLFSPSSNLVDVDVPEFINDKTAHLLAFAGITFLWQQYLRNLLWIIVGMLVFALFTEIVQYLLPISFHRSFDLKDIVADSGGIILGLVSSYIFDRLVKA